MAQKVLTIRVDDITGEEITDGGQQVRFAVNGTQYEIDLSEANAERSEEVLRPFVSHGRVVRKARTVRGSTETDAARIRAWAIEQGLEVGQVGRVSREVREAFAAAQDD